MGASSCASAFPDGVGRACARQGARTRDGAEEKIVGLGAGMGGADWDLPARAQAQASRICAPACERVQGPGRGDRGTGRRAVSLALARWSGRPCGRSRGDRDAEMKQRRRRLGRPRGRGTADWHPRLGIIKQLRGSRVSGALPAGAHLNPVHGTAFAADQFFVLSPNHPGNLVAR